MKKCEKSNYANTKWRKRGGNYSRRCSRNSPAAHGEDHSEAGCPLQPVKDHVRAAWRVEGPTLEQVDVPSKKLQSMESPAKEQTPVRSCSPWRGAGFVAGAVSPQSVPEELYPMERTPLEQFLKNYFSQGEEPTLRLWRTISHGSETVKGSLFLYPDLVV